MGRTFCVVGDIGVVSFVLVGNGDIDRFKKPAVKRFSAGLTLPDMTAPASILHIISPEAPPAVLEDKNLPQSTQHQTATTAVPDAASLSTPPLPLQQEDPPTAAFDPQLNMLFNMAADIEPQSFHATSVLPNADPLHKNFPDMESAQDSSIFVETPSQKSNIELDNLADEANATEVLKKKYPRRASFKDAIAAEYKGLSDKQAFREVTIPKDERKNINVLRSRFVLALKHVGTPRENKKARLTVQALRRLDKTGDSVFTYSPTSRKLSTRLLLVLAAAKNFAVYTQDISQAYVCSKFKLLRDIYVVPPKESNCGEDILLLMLKPLYGLPGPGLLWYGTYYGHNSDKFGLTATLMDPCFMCRHALTTQLFLTLLDQYTHQFTDNAELDGLISLQVVDSVGSGSDMFLENEGAASVAFPTKGRRFVGTTDTEFNGSELPRTASCAHIMHQAGYVHSLPQPPTT